MNANLTNFCILCELVPLRHRILKVLFNSPQDHKCTEFTLRLGSFSWRLWKQCQSHSVSGFQKSPKRNSALLPNSYFKNLTAQVAYEISSLGLKFTKRLESGVKCWCLMSSKREIRERIEIKDLNRLCHC